MLKKRYIFLIILVAHFVFMSGHLYSPDEEVMFRATQSFATELNFSIQPIQSGFGTKKGADGQQYAQYGIGQPILAAPFYYAGSLLSSITNGLIIDMESLAGIDYSMSYQDQSTPALMDRHAPGFQRLVVSLFNSFVAAFTGVILYIFLIEIGLSYTTCIMTTFLYTFATFAFVQNRTFFSEPLAGLMILISFLCLYKGFAIFPKDSKHKFFIFLAGIAAGYSMITRADSVLLLTGVGVYFFLKALPFFRKENEMPASPFVDSILFFAPILFFGCILLLINHLRYSGAFTTGYEDQPEGINFSTPFLAGAFGFLFSVGKGMFFFSPAIILAMFGFKVLYRVEQKLTIGLLTSIIIFFIAMCKWQNWAGGWCWGPRHIFQMHCLLAVFIAIHLEGRKHQTRRLLFTIFMIMGIAVNLLGSSVSFIEFYYDMYRTPRQSPSFRTLYSPDEFMVIGSGYEIYVTDEKGNRMNQVTPDYLQAPINDSIYVPQNSQWKGNFILLKTGKHDFFWIKMISGNLFLSSEE